MDAGRLFHAFVVCGLSGNDPLTALSDGDDVALSVGGQQSIRYRACVLDQLTGDAVGSQDGCSGRKAQLPQQLAAVRAWARGMCVPSTVHVVPCSPFQIMDGTAVTASEFVATTPHPPPASFLPCTRPPRRVLHAQPVLPPTSPHPTPPAPLLSPRQCCMPEGVEIVPASLVQSPLQPAELAPKLYAVVLTGACNAVYSCAHSLYTCCW
jgi:hypothetical protein